MGTPKVMKLVCAHLGHMECKVCGAEHTAMLAGGGRFKHGSWQCRNGCKIEDMPQKSYDMSEEYAEQTRELYARKAASDREWMERTTPAYFKAIREA